MKGPGNPTPFPTLVRNVLIFHPKRQGRLHLFRKIPNLESVPPLLVVYTEDNSPDLHSASWGRAVEPLKRRHIGLIPASKLDVPPREVRNVLAVDAYISINSFKTTSRHWPKEVHLKGLSAAWVDLDCGRGLDGLDYDEAVAEVYELVCRGMLPLPSVIENTGRGLRPYWLLRSGRGTDGFDRGLPRADFQNPHGSEANQSVECRAD